MGLLDIFFPKSCVGCNRLGGYICSDCIKNIKQTDLVCPFCEKNAWGGEVHPVCKRKYGLDGLWSLGVYDHSLKKAIQKLKYKWVRELAEELINLTVDYWARYQPLLLDQMKKNQGKDWLIVPVPLYKSRENWRGFNQAALLGKIFAKKLGLNYAEILRRVKNTKPQVGLEAFNRKQNIKNAFSLLPAINYELRTNNCLLVDDVWTTGSTLKECCFVLKRSGAKLVWAITLAR